MALSAASQMNKIAPSLRRSRYQTAATVIQPKRAGRVTPRVTYREVPATSDAPKRNLEIEVHPTEAGVSASLVSIVEKAAAAAIREKGIFTLAIPGGSVLKALGGLSGSKAGIDWSKVHLFYVNHKCVPIDDKSSTHHKARGLFLDAIGMTESNVVTTRGTSDAKKEAALYEEALQKVAQHMPKTTDGVPRFDLMLIGMGSDGHVGSLYPGRPETLATSGWVLSVDKKEPNSITLSAPVMSAAKHIVVSMTGASKAKTVQQALEARLEPGALPAQMIKPQGDATVVWLMDTAAAADLAVAKGARALL